MLEKSRHLINLLRPECVQQSPVPLSSDAFTWFGLHNHQEHNAEVAAMSYKLQQDLVQKIGMSL